MILLMHCVIFSCHIYTVLVLGSSFFFLSFPFFLILSTFTRSYHHFYLLFSFTFFVSEQLSFRASVLIRVGRVFFFFSPIVVVVFFY